MPVERIQRDDSQARKEFDEETLKELAASVNRVGILEPLGLRPNLGKNGHFVIVFGERRWRAAQLAGLATVPAIVIEGAHPVRRYQLYENVLRVDLNTVELADNVAAVMSEDRLDTKAFAEQLRWPMRKVQRLVEIYEAPEAVKRAIVKGMDFEGGKRVLSQRHALDVVRAHRHYARDDETRSKEKAAARLDRLVRKILEEDWSALKLQEYVGALGRSPKRDPLDRGPKHASPKDASAEATPSVTVASLPEVGSRVATELPLFEARTDRFTVFVKRARESSDATARAALANALRALARELAL